MERKAETFRGQFKSIASTIHTLLVAVGPKRANEVAVGLDSDKDPSDEQLTSSILTSDLQLRYESHQNTPLDPFKPRLELRLKQ